MYLIEFIRRFKPFNKYNIRSQLTPKEICFNIRTVVRPYSNSFLRFPTSGYEGHCNEKEFEINKIYRPVIYIRGEIIKDTAGSSINVSLILTPSYYIVAALFSVVAIGRGVYSVISENDLLGFCRMLIIPLFFYLFLTLTFMFFSFGLKEFLKELLQKNR